MGINRSSILLQLPSIHFPRSFPVDIMHCILQNITPKLLRIWLTQKPHLVPNQRQYLDEHDFEAIGEAMAHSALNIPTSLSYAPRRIDNHYSGFKAAEWKAWLLYFGIPLLRGRLPENCLHNFRTLSRIYYLASKWVLDEIEILQVLSLCIDFVRDYEALYYRYQDRLLPNCLINNHSLLHLADHIYDLGPACYWAQWTMERMCGIIKAKARSKSQMNASLINGVLLKEQLHHTAFMGYQTSIEPPKQIHMERLTLLNEYRLQLDDQQRRNHLRRIAAQLPFLPVPIENFTIRAFKRCQFKRHVILGSVESQRRFDVNRNNSRVAFRPLESELLCYGEVQYYINLSDIGYSEQAWIREYRTTTDPEAGTVRIDGLGSLKLIKMIWIESLIGIVDDGAKRYIVTDLDCFL